MDQQETIKLPIAILSGLYRNCLVDINNSETTTKPSTEEIEILPGKIVDTIVICRSVEQKLPLQQMDFLYNIMKACKLQKEDYAVFTDREADNLDYQSTIKQFKQKQLILFGLEPGSIGLPINFPHFQVQSFEQVRYLSAPGLETIEGDKALKMQLWQCLKQLFPS